MPASKSQRTKPAAPEGGEPKKKVLPAKPLKGDVDFVELRRSIMKRTSKTRARLAE